MLHAITPQDGDKRYCLLQNSFSHAWIHLLYTPMHFPSEGRFPLLHYIPESCMERNLQCAS